MFAVRSVPVATDMIERHRLMLAEFAELCLGPARDLQARQLAAEDAAEAAALAGALHKMGGSLRQTMAFEARLERDATLEIAADLPQAERLARAPILRRKEQISAALERLIWTETEQEDALDLQTRLDDLMAEDDLHDRFAEGPVEDHIRRLCIALGLAGPKDDILIYPPGSPPPPAPPNSS